MGKEKKQKAIKPVKVETAEKTETEPQPAVVARIVVTMYENGHRNVDGGKLSAAEIAWLLHDTAVSLKPTFVTKAEPGPVQ